MTEDRLPLAELLAKAGDGDFLRSVAEAVVQLLMEADVEGVIGAGRHERSGERPTWRNGYRDRTLDTRLGHAAAAHPQAAAGQLLPALPGAPQDLGEGAGGGDPGGLDRRRLDPARGRPGAGDGPGGHQQEHGLQAVQGHRRARGGLPRPPARRATGPISGWTPPTSSSARAAASSPSPR